MTSPEPRSSDERDVEALAHAQGLDLPDARLTTLARTLAEFTTAFEKIWQLDPGDHEPSAITFDDEAR